tara:strand:- start:707 stop:985 length:279 start_codon:yes stop_codon:yes gene_type:complete
MAITYELGQKSLEHHYSKWDHEWVPNEEGANELDLVITIPLVEIEDGARKLIYEKLPPIEVADGERWADTQEKVDNAIHIRLGTPNRNEQGE